MKRSIGLFMVGFGFSGIATQDNKNIRWVMAIIAAVGIVLIT